MTLRCVSFPNSVCGAVSGANAPLSSLTLVKFELAAMMVLALCHAATNLECGLAPLEHGFLCGLAHIELGPRQCVATPILPYVASVGVEMVSGTPGAGGCACVVAMVAEVFISGILMVFEWGAAMVIVSVGHMLMNSGDVLEVPYPCLCCDDAESMCSSWLRLSVPPW